MNTGGYNKLSTSTLKIGGYYTSKPLPWWNRIPLNNGTATDGTPGKAPKP